MSALALPFEKRPFPIERCLSAKRGFSDRAKNPAQTTPCRSGQTVRQFPMLTGYARVSTTDQNLSLQRDALQAAGCEKIFPHHGVSESLVKRSGLNAALKSLRPGDTLIVWKLDRRGRSLPHLVETVADLGARGINFRSLSDPIDTQSAGGRPVLHIMAALAEFERSIIIERTRAGLAAAERRGRKLGRPRSLSPFDAEAARDLLDMGDAVADVARALGIARSTLYESLARNETKAAAPMRLRRAKPYGPNPECPHHRIDRSFHLLRKTLVLRTCLNPITVSQSA
jgi:DNA invertase Pin-like site-specific DNA recombinase